MPRSYVQLKQRVLFSKPQKTRSYSPPPLPVDVLWEIFSILLDQCPTVSQKHETLFSISHVCSVWREAAVSHYRLWAEILNPSDPCSARFEEILSRARNAPFSITANIKFESQLPTQPQWQKVLSQMDRATRIDILFEGEREIGKMDLKEMFKPEVPSLKELFISCETEDDQFVAFQFPLKKLPCFNGNATSLRVLELYNCVIVPSLIMTFPNLTDLTIAGSPSMARISIVHLVPWWDMCFTQKMPSLQNLTIKRAANTSETVRRARSERRSQPGSLRMIHLSGEMDAIARIMKPERSALPRSCDVRLEIEYPSRFPGNPARTLDRVLSEIWGSDSSPCLEFTLDNHLFMMFKHTSAVRTIWISGNSEVCRPLMLRIVNKRVVTKLNLTLQTVISALEVVQRPRNKR
ncbi:hypothetical protein MD484_g5579, partial [Candolleomyces efflorescens]